jgi:hypothetical protein
LIDWCLTSTLTVFQLYHGLKKLYKLILIFLSIKNFKFISCIAKVIRGYTIWKQKSKFFINLKKIFLIYINLVFLAIKTFNFWTFFWGFKKFYQIRHFWTSASDLKGFLNYFLKSNLSKKKLIKGDLKNDLPNFEKWLMSLNRTFLKTPFSLQKKPLLRYQELIAMTPSCEMYKF